MPPCRLLPTPHPSALLPIPPQMYGKTLERDLKGDLSGDMEQLFVGLVKVGGRLAGLAGRAGLSLG